MLNTLRFYTKTRQTTDEVKHKSVFNGIKVKDVLGPVPCEDLPPEDIRCKDSYYMYMITYELPDGNDERELQESP